MPNANGDYCIGTNAEGRLVWVSTQLFLTHSIEELQYQLIDRTFIERGMTPPGYFPVRTSLTNSDFLWIKAKTHEEAVTKFLENKRLYEYR